MSDKGIERYCPFCRSRLRSWLVVAGVLLGLAGYSRIEFWNYAAGAVMILPGLLLHFFCKANLRQNTVLTRSGAYRWVRHPFYLANALVDFGLCMLIGRWELLLVFGICWAIAYTRQIRKEERNLIGLFGDEYRRYRKEVPAILPWKLRPSAETGETRFSMKNPNIDTGKEVGRILRYASYPYLFFTAALAGQDGIKVFIEGSSWALIPPAAFLCIYWLGIVSQKYAAGKRSALASAMEHFTFRLAIDVLILGALIVTEGLIPEINGPNHILATALVSLLLIFPCMIVLLETAGKAWASYRFRIMTEMCFLVIMCALGGLFYLIAVPVFFYAPALVFGSADDHRRHALSADIVAFDSPKFALNPIAAFKGALLSFGFAILFIQEILHIHILSLA